MRTSSCLPSSLKLHALRLFLFAPIGILIGILPGNLLAQTVPPANAQPDVIVFTNGDQLTGKLLRGVGNTVVFHSDMAGDITVPLDKVKQLQSLGSFALLPKSKTPLNLKQMPPIPIGTLSYAAETKQVVVVVPQNAPPASAAPGEHSLAASGVGFIVDQPTYIKNIATRPGLLSGWSGAVTAGITDTRATQYGETVTAGLSAVRLQPTVSWLPARNRTTFNLQETFGQLTSPTIPQTNPPTPPTVVKTSVFHTDFERDEYFEPNLYALGEFSFDHNFAQGLDLQQVYGAGAGYTPIKDAKQQLDLKADVHYESQAFLQTAGTPFQPTLNLIGSTFAENYRRTLPKKILLTESGNILPAWNELNAYSANGTIALALPVFKRLSASISLTDNFLNNPAAGYQKNSFQFVTGITYSLK